MKLFSYLFEIKKTIDLLKILIAYTIILFLALLPIIIATIGGYLESIIKNHPVNEANSEIIAIGWLAMFTIPGGFLVFIVYTFMYIKNVYSFMKKRN